MPGVRPAPDFAAAFAAFVADIRPRHLPPAASPSLSLSRRQSRDAPGQDRYRPAVRLEPGSGPEHVPPRAESEYRPLPGTRRPPHLGLSRRAVPGPEPAPGPHLDGYPECGLADGHEPPHDYRRHAAPRAEPEPEAEP